MNLLAVRYLVGSLIALVGFAMAAPLAYAVAAGEPAVFAFGVPMAAALVVGWLLRAADPLWLWRYLARGSTSRGRKRREVEPQGGELRSNGVPKGELRANEVPGSELPASELRGGKLPVGQGQRVESRTGERGRAAERLAHKIADEIGIHEVVLVVVGGWCAAVLFGAVPFLLTGALPDPVDALFESVSGFTTTSATVITDVQALPRSVLVWRAVLNWLGGLGIVVLFVGVFSKLGVGGNQLFRTEMSSLTTEKIRPRIRETARLFWGFYAGLTLAAALLLWAAGLPPFDAVLHALSTVSTGGFSTRNASIAEFSNPMAEAVIAVFMFLGATNFALLYRAVRRRELDALVYNREFQAYVGVILGAALLVALGLWGAGDQPFWNALRVAVFQVVSMISTTGFVAEDFTSWPAGATAVLFAVMFVSGMSGSTAGGTKMIRILIAAKHGLYGIVKLLHPRSVTHLRLGDLKVPDPLVMAVGSFLFLYLLVFAAGFVILSFAGFDMTTSASLAIATLGNTGLAFGEAGILGNYAFLPGWIKLFLSFLMLVGRLEIYSVLVLFLPSFWSRK